MMRTYIKKVYYAIEAGDKAAAEAAYKEAYEVSNAGKSGPFSLYNKVSEGIKRVKRHIKRIKM